MEKVPENRSEAEARVECHESQTAEIQLNDPHPRKSKTAPTKGLWDLLSCVSEHDEGFETWNTNDRDVLCLNLALSLLYLSTTCWGRASWRSNRKAGDGIFFLRDPATRMVVDKTQPYLSYALNEGIQPEDDDDLICDPHLLEFAKLILEIRMWPKVPFKHEYGRLPKRKLLEFVLDTIDDKLQFPARDRMFQLAVKACLDAAGREAAQDKTDNRLQNYIFEKIVRPLEQYADFPDLSTSALANFPFDNLEENSEENWELPFDWKRDHSTEGDNLSVLFTVCGKKKGVKAVI